MRQYQSRTSPSPSPLKRSSAPPNLRKFWEQPEEQLDVGDDGEEDEETLQLQLAALTAKIKLKKLQARKHKATGLAAKVEDENSEMDQSVGKENTRPFPDNQDILEKPASVRPKSAAEIQIPVSPQRKRVVAEEARSPGRVLLGIDKGLKGKNISLRRPVGEGCRKDDAPFTVTPCTTSRATGSLNRSRAQQPTESARPKSFSERIAETRQQDRTQKDRANLLRRQRSTGFGVDPKDIDAFQQAAETRSGTTQDRQSQGSRVGTVEFSREEILKASGQPNGGLVHRSNTSAGIRRTRKQGIPVDDIWLNPNAPPELSKRSKPISNASKPSLPSKPSQPQAAEPPAPALTPETASLFEPFSSLHLSKRQLPHSFLTQGLAGKHIFLLPELLGTVKSPDYLLPDIPEPDHVVLAILASKSDPLSHKGAQKSTSTDKTAGSEAIESEQNANGKYMVFALTDLKWTVDLFLFTTAYTRFRKLTPGTVVALLNPDVMPPPPGRADTGRFSLKLTSSDDTVLEIGTSRDLGWCKSVRKDGKPCGSWIDKRHTEFCEFHVDAGVERTRRGRMEVQGMSAPFAPGGRRGGRTGYFGDKRRGQNRLMDDGFAREGAQYDRGTASRYFVGPSIPGGRSAAQLLDAEGTVERGSKEERVRKRLAEREKENEIARKLGEGGNGAGSDYLRMIQSSEASGKDQAEPQAADPVDAASLGLLGNRATTVHLSPIKKRKRGTMNIEGSRKKTRFVTDRGIKEAGRESLGGDIGVRDGGICDDDDGLEVV